MACTNPMLMVCVSGKNLPLDWRRFEKRGFKFNDDHSKGYKLTNKETRNLELEHIDSWVQQDLIEVPCGKCVQCQLAKSRDWAVRCTHEASKYQHNYFITLTYDDDHLPLAANGNATLVPEHLRQFLNSVRKKFSRQLDHKGVRFIACGEYNSDGSRMLNPHYHLILFNAPIPGLTIDIPGKEPGTIIHKLNGQGTYMLWSKWIQELWCDEDGNPRGYIRIDDANYNTESYVSQYILKKQTGEHYDVYSKTLGVINPFFRCSNRPGIGFDYYEQHKDEFIDNPSVIIGRPVGNSVIAGIPRYYKKHLFEYDPSVKDSFIAKAKHNAKNERSLTKFNGSTTNQQRTAIEEHYKVLNEIRSRNFDEK